MIIISTPYMFIPLIIIIILVYRFVRSIDQQDLAEKDDKKKD